MRFKYEITYRSIDGEEETTGYCDSYGFRYSTSDEGSRPATLHDARRGWFIQEADSLEDMLDVIRKGGFDQPSTSPVSLENCHCTSLSSAPEENYLDGTTESFSLHFEDVSPRNVLRILRLAGVAR